LASAAIALATPQAAMAEGASASTASQLQEALAEIRQLQQQVAELQARMDQQSATTTQANQAAQAAQQKADRALAQASTASTTAVAANTTAEKANKGLDLTRWAADTRISGRMYFNISHVSAHDYAGDRIENDGGFQIKRLYVGIDHRFSNVFSGNITVDADNVIKSASLSGSQASGYSLSTSNAGQGLYVKKAYLEAKLDPALVIRLGSADMPWIPYVEDIYGYRYVEKALTDANGFGTSADWGVHVMGSLANGLVSYQVSAVDGGGYRNPQLTRTVDVEGRLSLKYKGVNAAIGGYVGKLGKNTQGAATFHSAKRFDALLAYKDTIGGIPVTIGGEYFYAKDWNNGTSVAEDSSDGFSLFASASPIRKWSVFGRYDWVKPSRELNPAWRDHYFNVGIEYNPIRIVDLALVYKRDAANGGLAIGNIAKVNGLVPKTRDEIGLYGQFRF
jgi:hypothetical protein